MKIVAITLLLIAQSLSSGQAFLFREKTDFADGSEKGEVRIDIANTTLRRK